MKNYKENKLFRFEGKNTHGNIRYLAEGNTLLELMNNLMEKGEVFSLENYHNYFAEKQGLELDDLNDEEWYDFADKIEFKNDQEIISFIKAQDGNAFYQKIFKYNYSSKEYELIS